MAKYRKRSVTIEAVQWRGDNLEEVRTFLGADFVCCDHATHRITCRTKEGALDAVVGCYFLRGIEGEHYPRVAVIFTQTYDSVPEREEEAAWGQSILDDPEAGADAVEAALRISTAYRHGGHHAAVAAWREYHGRVRAQ